MRPSAHTARRMAAIIGLISTMLLTGVADREGPGSRAVEQATAVTGEIGDEGSGHTGSGHTGSGHTEGSGRNEASGRDEALRTVEDHAGGLGEQIPDTIDDAVDHTTDTVHETVTDTTEAIDDTVDHTTDTVDDAVGHTSDTVDRIVEGTTDTVDRVDDPPADEQPSSPDGAPSPADGEPASPVDPTLPTAAGPSGQAPDGAAPAEEDAESDDGASGLAPSDSDEPGSLFNGSGGIGERAPFPLALMLILAGFLGVQAWVDRRDPKLAAAPLETEPDLVFERP